MSWNKNTINMSNLDSVKAVLDDLHEAYTLSIIGKVRGMGLNDEFSENDGKHELRRLQYNNFVILEQIAMDNDCDVNDIITSSKFSLDQEPKNWKIIVKTDVCKNNDPVEN